MNFHFLEQYQVDCGITHNNKIRVSYKLTLISHYESANF